MADGKWITGLTPEMPADEAARVVLSVRLSAVRHYLPLAAERAAEDVEHVHQLRVATRRAGTAVRIFRDLLPKKVQRAVKQVLRVVRRAAGGARDWDVFLSRVARQDSADFLVGYALRERLTAQNTLVAVAGEQSAAVHEGCTTVPAAVRSPSGPSRSLSDHATTVLGDLFSQFTIEVEGIPAAAAELHRLRITAKRLRYAMEVFAGCCAPSLREVLYPAVEEAQEILGRVQDATVAASRLGQIADELQYLPNPVAGRLRPGVAALAEDAKSNTARGEQEFHQWVERWQRLSAEHPRPETWSPAVG